MKNQLNSVNIQLDNNGFLQNLQDWSPSVAELLAANEGIVLTDPHWQIIYTLRQFYTEFELSPAMRPLTKYITQNLGADKGKSIYLLQLFPGSPAKIAAKIAGLPKPDNCL
ncbi:MAG: TusE/DsrC/DsvC family sulfur relay protein [Spongiibacteraceae bacterium]|jgi:tRNA 2-thiouridine synthesizing protein E